MTNIVIGLGTGRCGTHSLTNLLNTHPDIRATHERCGLGWAEDVAVPVQAITNMRNWYSEPIVSDVAFYWLDYIDNVIELYPDTKFICFKRDKVDVVNSFMRTGSFAMHHRIMKVAFGQDVASIMVGHGVSRWGHGSWHCQSTAEHSGSVEGT